MAESIKSFLPIIEDSLQNLVSWHRKYGDAGYDPYDIRSCNTSFNRISSSPQNLWDKVSGVLVFDVLDQYFPVMMRRLLRVKKKIHPTAMGLFFASYLGLDQLFPGKGYGDLSDYYRKWLIENRVPGYEEYAWGLPFHWGKYGSNTPFAVVNAWIGDAFFRSYKIHGKKEDLEVCKSICRFFTHSLHISPAGNNTICFSYSPIKPDFINNANLFVAEYLVRIGQELGHDEYIEMGLRAAGYSLGNQRDNGLIPYFGREQNGPVNASNDLYHSGYELRMLSAIGQHTGEDKYKIAAGKYWNYITSQHLKEGYIPRTKTNKGYVDVTACAEIILVYHSLLQGKGNDQLLTGYRSTLQWIIDHFQDRKGYFYYKVRRTGYITKIPYIRWGQAWMLHSLTDSLTLLRTLIKDESSTSS